MNASEYQRLITQTCAVTNQSEQLLLASLGLADELAELIGPVRACTSGQRNQQQLIDESGDFLWYLALAQGALGQDLSLKPPLAAWIERNLHPNELKAHQDPYGCLLDLLEAVGMLTGPIKKSRFHGHPIDLASLIDAVQEIGHRFCYFLDVLDLNIDEIMHANKEKLLKRYPHGFSSQRSIQREAAR